MAGAADIGIRVFLEDAASGGLGSVNSALRQLAGNAAGASSAFSKLSAAQITGLGILAGSAIALYAFSDAIIWAIQQASALDDAMALIQINVAGAAGVMPQLQDALTAVADASIYTNTEVADGIAKLGTYGFTAMDVLANNNQLVTSMVDLAEATGSKVVPAADALATAMRFYNIPASQSVQVANDLDFAFHNGQNSMSGLVDAIKQVAPAANALHVNLQDTVIALDMLGQAGITGSTAGVDLRYALQNLVAPTKAAETELEHLGIIAYTHTTPALQAFIDKLAASGNAGYTAAQAFTPTVEGLRSIFDAGQKLGLIPLKEDFIGWAMSTGALNDKLFTASGQFRGLKPLLDTLAQSLRGMSDEAKITAVRDLFGVRASQGALALANNIITLDQNWSALTLKLQNTKAQNDAAVQLDTLSGSLKALNTTFQNIGAAIGQQLTGPLTAIAQHLNLMLGPLTAVNSAAGKAGAVFLATGLSLAAIGIPIAIVVGGLMGLLGALGTIIGVAALVVLGIVLLAAAVAGLVVWFQHLWQTSAGFRATLIGLGQGFAQVGALLWATIVAVAQAVGATIMPMLRELWSTIQSQLIPAWHQLITALAPVLPYLRIFGQYLGVFVILVIMTVILFLGALVGAIAGAAVRIIQGFTMILSGVMMMNAGFTNILHGIVLIFVATFQLLTGHVEGARLTIMRSFSLMGTGIAQLVNGAWLLIKGIIFAVLGAIAGFVMGFVMTVINFFQHLSTTLVGHSIVPDMMNAIRNVIINGLASAVGAIGAGVAAMIAAFVHMGAMIVSVVVNAWNTFRSVVASGIAAAASYVSSGAAAMVGRILSLGASIVGSANSAWAGFRNAVAGGVANAVGVVSGLPGRIMGILGGLAGMLYSSGANAMGSFASGLGSMLGSVISQVAAAANAVAGFLAHHSPAKMGPLSDDDKWMPNMMKMFAEGIKAHTPLIHSAATGVAVGLTSVPSVVAGHVATVQAQAQSGQQAGRTQTVQFVVNGQVLSTAILDYTKGVLQMNGGGRLLR